MYALLETFFSEQTIFCSPHWCKTQFLFRKSNRDFFSFLIFPKNFYAKIQNLNFSENRIFGYKKKCFNAVWKSPYLGFLSFNFSLSRCFDFLGGKLRKWSKMSFPHITDCKLYTQFFQVRKTSKHMADLDSYFPNDILIRSGVWQVTTIMKEKKE